MDPIFIKRYRVIEELGRGGMGIVYKGEDPTLERCVAIKILPPKLLRNQDALHRFLREAKVAARLDHPNIIKVFDIDEENGIYHIVMEFVEGVTLREYLETRKSFPLDETLHLFRQICSAIDYAHQQKVIHRDLKPENIMVVQGRTIKVMDFGIAVMDDRHSVTEAGVLVGTIAYVSPEQARGMIADARSDIYSLGVLFFEMLTGRLPFDATNPSEMLQKHLNEKPLSPLQCNPALPPGVEGIVYKTLEKDPADRYQRVEEFLLDVEKLATGSAGVMTPPATPEGYMASPSPYVVGTSVKGTERLPPHPPPHPPPPKKTRPGTSGSPALSWEETVIFDQLREVLREQGKSDRDLPTLLKDEALTKQFLKGPTWSRFKPIIDRLRKDEAFLAQLGGVAADVEDVAEVAGTREVAEAGGCPKCGSVNTPEEKYCQECGNLLRGGVVTTLAVKGARAHLDLAISLYNEGKYSQASRELLEALSRDPNLSEVPFYEGSILLEQGKNEEALPLLLKSVELDPRNPLYLERLGEAYFRLGSHHEAVQAFRKGIASGPSTALFCKLAMTLEASGKDDEARKALTKAIELDPSSTHAMKQLVRLLGKGERWDEMLSWIEKILAVDPSDVEAYRLRGEVCEKTGKPAMAIKSYEKALDCNPKDAGTYTRLGDLFLREHRHDLALEEYRKAVEVDPRNWEARLKLGDVYVKEGKTEQAISEMEKVANLQPNNPQIHRSLGQLYYQKSRWEQAMAQYEWTVALDPFDSDSHFKLGLLYYQKDLPSQAIKSYKTAIYLDPANPEFHEGLGMVYYMEEDMDRAIEEMKKASALDARNIDYVKALGVMYEAKHKPDLAAKEYQKAVEIAPQDPLAHGLLGRAYLSSGLLNLAIYEYQKSLELEPRSYLVRTLLGKAYRDQKRLDLALGEFKAAVDLAPRGDHPRARQLLGKAYLNVGTTHMEMGDLDEAEEFFRTAQEIIPDDPGVHRSFGQLHAARGGVEKGIAALKKAVNLNPRDPSSLLELATLFDRRGESESAKATIRKALAIDSTRADCHEFLAGLLKRQGEREEAIKTYMRALEQAPSRKDFYHWQMGILYAETQNYDEAIYHYIKAIEANQGSWHYHKDLARSYEETGKISEAIQELERARGKNPDPPSLSLIEKDLERLNKKLQRQSQA